MRHLIPHMFDIFANKISAKVLPFDEIKLELVEVNYLQISYFAETRDEVKSGCTAALEALANKVNAIDKVVRFQRIVWQPISGTTHREILTKDGICLRYTVNGKKDGYYVTFDCVAFPGVPIEYPETD